MNAYQILDIRRLFSRADIYKEKFLILDLLILLKSPWAMISGKGAV